MRDDTQFVDRVEPPQPFDVVKYAVGKGKELFVGLAAHALALLVAVSLDFRTHDEMAAHVGLDGFPLPLLAVEVHSLVVDEHLLYR